MFIGAAGASAVRASGPPPGETPSSPTELADRNLQINAWGNALDADPESAIALGQLAGLHLQRARETGDRSDYIKAEEYARRSLALRVDRNAKSYVTLATALLAEHRFSDAELVAQQAVAYDPGVPQYTALLADIKAERGDYAGAKVLFDSLYRFQSMLSIAPRVARWAELNGDVQGSARILRRATKRAAGRNDLPKEQIAWFHYRLGDFEMRHGRFNRARKEFVKGLAVEPADYRILPALAKLSLLKDEPRRAIEYAERALAIRIDPAPLAILAEAHLARGDSAAAKESMTAMDIAIQGQPGAYHRAWTLFLLDYDRRIHEVHANAAGELETRKDIYGYDVLAWSEYKLGRFEEAARNMHNALKLGTRDPMLLYHAGMIEKARGRRVQARAFLQAALAVNDQFDYRGASLARASLELLE